MPSHPNSSFHPRKMSTICADHHHRQYSPTNKKQQQQQLLFKDLRIPPRKLLLAAKSSSTPKYHQDFGLDDMSSSYEAHFYKHLPCNNEAGGRAHYLNEDEDDDYDDDDPYSSDQFRMYEFKVRRCTRSRSHDWTDCPFAHPGEKARRRDPRKFHYTGIVCPEFRRGGGCAHGDNCEFAHGVFECWLHPSRYRTEACKDGKNCKRKVCFFAHTPRQLRLLQENASPAAARKINNHHHHHQCGGCLGGGGRSCSSVASSPTSTLLGMSHLSPPLSPSMSSSSPPMSPVSGHHRMAGSGGGGGGFSHRLSKFQPRFMSCKDVLNELISSLEAMNFSSEEAVAAAAAAAAASASSTPGAAGRKINLSVNPWISEVCFNDQNNNNRDDNYHYQHQLDQQQQQFVMSPSPSPSTPNANSVFDKYFIGGDRDFFPAKFNGRDSEFVAGTERMIDNDQNGVGLGDCDADLGWVNELLM